MDFEALGKQIRYPRKKLEVFPKPPGVVKVIMSSDEVTSLCPVTGQPDWETVIIEYEPDDYCIESKSLKLYLWSFREEGHFCEALAAKIAQDIQEAAKPKYCRVIVIQKPRGGIKIEATAVAGNPPHQNCGVMDGNN
ncbi:MAG: preQ(1) synthase [Moorellaceae bacterium]